MKLQKLGLWIVFVSCQSLILCKNKIFKMNGHLKWYSPILELLSYFLMQYIRLLSRMSISEVHYDISCPSEAGLRGDFSWQVQENHDWYQYSENCSIPWLKTLLKFPVSTSITCVWCLWSCHWGNTIILVCFQILQSGYSNKIKIINTAITIYGAVSCMQGISRKNL